MSKRSLRILLLALLTLALASCGDDKSPTGTGGGGGGDGGGTNTMAATVDGEAWTAVTANAFNQSGIVVVGSSNLGGELGIGFGFVDSGARTYSIGLNEVTNFNITGLTGNAWSARGVLGSGTLTVTTLSATRLAGSFEFTAPLSVGTGPPATRVVTNGVFDLELQPAP